MRPSSDLGLVFLGCGRAAAMNARAIRALDRDVRIAFASRDRERARAFAQRHHAFAWYGSYAEALADPKTQAAFVVTPPSSHLELTLAALGAGKSVIVEKPPFLAAAELDQVREAAGRAGRRVYVAENYFYKPLARALREIVRSGLIGETMFVHLNALKRQRDDGWRSSLETCGGGALYEGGIHWINLLANLGPEVASIAGRRAGRSTGPERSVLVDVSYRGGAQGCLLYSWEIDSPLRGLRLSHLFGSRGTITFESNGLFLLLRGLKTRLHLPGLRDLSGRRAMLHDFLAALREGRDPELGLDRVRIDLELVEQVYRSLARTSEGTVI